MNELHRSMGNAPLGIHISGLALADFNHMVILAQYHGTAIGTLQAALLLQGPQILADTVLRHTKLLAELLYAHLSFGIQHVHNAFLTLFQKHDITLPISLNLYFQTVQICI